MYRQGVHFCFNAILLLHLFSEANMKNISWPSIFFLSALFIQLSVVAQEVQDNVVPYKWFDGVIGVENTNLLNGIEYIEQHVTINEHQKFLGSIYFTPGWLVYDGQPYYDLDMKYNVYDDLLLLRGTGSKALQLHKSRVQEFSLDGHDFVNINADTTAAVKGFYEVMLETEVLSLLKKHTKNRKKYLDRSFTYFEFHEDTPRYAIEHQGQYRPMNSRREVIRAFPDHAREIRQFYRERRSQARSNPDLFMIDLSKKLFQLSSSTTLQE